MITLIVDIDGTVANIDHRLPYIEQEPKDWDTFFDPELVMKDEPIAEAGETLNKLKSLCNIVFLTGRPEKLKSTTVEWLNKHYGLEPNEYELYMRPGNSELPSARMKKNVLEDITPGMDEIYLIDDETENLQMMSEFGEAIGVPEGWDILKERFDIS